MTPRMSGTGHITHVSDTARWTALHRATESARPDARRFHRLPLFMGAVARLPQPDPHHPGNRPWSAAALCCPLSD
jgi:hypothetical protein